MLRDKRHRDGDRRRPDHERRAFESRRTGTVGALFGRRRTYDDRRKAENGNQARRQGPRDRRDLDFDPDKLSDTTPFPDDTTMKVITAEGILEAARLLTEMTPELLCSSLARSSA